MRVKKTVTEPVLLANRLNGRKNKTGPRNTTTTRYHAVTHGFLARKVIFRDEAEEKEFKALVASLRRYVSTLPQIAGARSKTDKVNDQQPSTPAAAVITKEGTGKSIVV